MTSQATGSLLRRALTGTVWLTAGQYGSSIVALAGNLALARLIGPEPFGRFFVVSALVELLFVLGTFSFGQYLIQAPRVSRRHYQAIMVWSAALAVALVLIAVSAAGRVAARYPADVMSMFVWLSVLRAAWCLTLVMSCVLDRAMAYRQLSTIRFASAAASVTLALSVAVAGGTTWSLVAREIGSLLAGAALTWHFVRRTTVFEPSQPGDTPYADVWRFGFRVSLVQLLEQAFHRLDGVLLGRMAGLSPSELGYYSQAKYISNVPIIAADAGTRAVAYRVYAELQHDDGALRRSLETLQFWAIRSVMPIVVLFAALPDRVFRTLMGDRWAAGGSLLQSLAWYGLLMILFNNLKMFRLVRHEWNTLYLASLIEIVVLALTLTIGVRLFGIRGAAVSFVLANLAGLIAVSGPTSRADGRLLGFATLRAPLGAAAAAMVVGLLLPALPTIAGFLVSASLVLSVYGLAIWLLEGPALQRSFRELRTAAFARS